MKEAVDTRAGETASVRSGEGGHAQEEHLQEDKGEETRENVELTNYRISDATQNGTTSGCLERRLQTEITRPEVQEQLIHEFSPYSEQVNSFIKTTRELSVYTENHLQESQAFDRPSLQLKIDPERTDAMGQTNVERTAAGRAPIDENGDPVNLHHIGQRENSPLAELPDRVHKQSDAILHDKSIPTEVHGEGNDWNEVRSRYWQERSTTI